MDASTWWLAFAVLGASPGSVQHVQGDDVATRVQQELQARTVAIGSAAQVRIATRVADQSLPAGPLRIEIGEVAGRWPRARAGVPVRLNVDGYAPRPLTVWVSASDPRTVMAYTADYAAGTSGASVGAAPAVIDMVCCDPATVAGPHELSERRLRRPVRAGAPVLAADLEPLPAVTAQQAVAIAVERGPVRIVMPGVALQDGAMGEHIAVRTQSSHHAVQVRVVAKGQVIVDE